MDTLFVLLAVVVVLAGLFNRRRVRDRVQGAEMEGFGDEAIDEDAIDEDAIRAAEDEFWEKDWEEPEEWGH